MENCHALAAYFNRPIKEVLRLAGYPTEDDKPIRAPERFAARAENLTEEQWNDLTEYAEFLLERERRKGTLPPDEPES